MVTLSIRASSLLTRCTHLEEKLDSAKDLGEIKLIKRAQAAHHDTDIVMVVPTEPMAPRYHSAAPTPVSPLVYG